MFNMNNNMFGNMNLNNNVNINPMGMNNQPIPNLAMDFSAMRIKAIIDPYEKKITELEQIIKQKDFEITLLKEKLYDITNNQMMMNMQNNMNIMNPMMMNNNGNFVNNFNFNMANNCNNMNLNLLNNNNNILLKDWIINFNYKGKNYTEQCNKEEKLEAVYKRFCNKLGIKLTAHKLIFDSLPPPKDMTLIECGIYNNSKILVIEKERVKSDNDSFYYYTDKECEYDCECEGLRYNVSFKGSTDLTTTINLGKEHSIGALIRKYLRRIPTREFSLLNSNSIWCSFNYSLNWKIDNKKKLKDIFSFSMNCMETVFVNEMHCLNGS